MCVIIKQGNKEIKLKRLKHFNSHIHKRFFCDSKLNVWYKPKGEDLKPIGLEELDSLSELYPSSIRHIYQLKDFYRFTTGVHLCRTVCHRRSRRNYRRRSCRLLFRWQTSGYCWMCCGGWHWRLS